MREYLPGPQGSLLGPLDYATNRGAALSLCGTYRYSLWRAWSLPVMRLAAFVMLNPSTANEMIDDPTIRRCIGFAKLLGFDGLSAFNLFAYRSTDPLRLPLDLALAVGPDNDHHIASIDHSFEMVIAAWGTKGSRGARDKAVLRILTRTHDVQCLRKTKHGAPEHPLYIPYTVKPVLFAAKEVPSAR